jgi:uncharacterized HAD superfamily protein
MRTIGIDMDGVLYNWHESLYEHCRLFEGYEGSYWEFWNNYRNVMTEEHLEYLIQLDTLYSNILPTKQCKELLNNLASRYEIFYVTARPKTVQTTTESYLKRHKFPFRENLVFSEDKVSVARRYQFSFAIDDHPKHLKGLSEVTSVVMVLQPWNKEYRDVFPTAVNLLDILNYIKE